MKWERYIVIGACGAIGRRVVRRLADAGKAVLGIDPRPWQGPLPDGVQLSQVSLGKKRIVDDLFRSFTPDAVVHVGLRSSPRIDMDVRYEHNVVGMQRLVALCGAGEVRRLVVLSRGTVYGADWRNPVFLNEDAPLRGSSHHAELRDIVEADILAQSLALREPRLSLAVLRPANIVGPEVRNTMVSYLRLPVVPMLLGFDPMLQLVHEEDVVGAVLRALESDAPGVFNIAGGGALPLKAIISHTGGTPLPLLLPFFGPVVEALWRKKLSPAPLPHVDYLRYPCLLDDRRARQVLGYEPRYDLAATLEAVRSRRRTLGGRSGDASTLTGRLSPAMH